MSEGAVLFRRRLYRPVDQPLVAHRGMIDRWSPSRRADEEDIITFVGANRKIELGEYGCAFNRSRPSVCPGAQGGPACIALGLDDALQAEGNSASRSASARALPLTPRPARQAANSVSLLS